MLVKAQNLCQEADGRLESKVGNTLLAHNNFQYTVLLLFAKRIVSFPPFYGSAIFPSMVQASSFDPSGLFH